MNSGASFSNLCWRTRYGYVKQSFWQSASFIEGGDFHTVAHATKRRKPMSMQEDSLSPLATFNAARRSAILLVSFN